MAPWLLLGRTVAPALLSACTARAAPQGASQQAAIIRVVMRDHAFEPATVRLTSGQETRLDIVNEGAIAHALMIGRELERLTWGAGGRPLRDFFDGVNVSRSIKYGSFDTSRATEVTLYPGGSASLVFAVPADKTGEWEIGCLIPGHYESGMRGTLIVD